MCTEGPGRATTTTTRIAAAVRAVVEYAAAAGTKTETWVALYWPAAFLSTAVAGAAAGNPTAPQKWWRL